jgi:hypothetical protein
VEFSRIAGGTRIALLTLAASVSNLLRSPFLLPKEPMTTLIGTKTIMATYSSATGANLSLDALDRLGVAKEHISVMALDADTKGELKASHQVGKASDDAATGAWQGAKLGLVGGLLVGVAALTIPGLGLLLAAGPLAASMGLTGLAGTAVTGAGLGTAIGGIGALVGSMVKMGVPEVDANAFGTDLKSGGVLLSVKEQDGVDVMAALNAGQPTRMSTVG